MSDTCPACQFRIRCVHVMVAPDTYRIVRTCGCPKLADPFTGRETAYGILKRMRDLLKL